MEKKELCRDCKKNEAQIHGLCAGCCDCCQDGDRPMGVGQWKIHGKQYGYWDFFQADIKKMIEGMRYPEKLKNPFYPSEGKKYLDMKGNKIYNQAIEDVLDKLK